jgi:hypothetical protein
MQLSAANLLLASQQAPKPQAAQPQAGAQFAQALAKERGVASTEGFAPMAFKQTAAPAAPAQPQPAPGYAQNMRPGSHLDIRI